MRCVVSHYNSELKQVIYEERWFQVEAVNSIFEYFDSGKTGNPVVAMPCGLGKSYVIAMFLKEVFARYPTQRVMMITHSKKLIQQNAEKLLDLWPTAPIGIHSEGLSQRDTQNPIIYGGIQSICPTVKKSERDDADVPPQYRHFGWRDLLLHDENHLLSPEDETTFQYVIAKLKEINPHLKVIGLTATPYRMKQGLITDNGIMTDICYDVTDRASYNRLIAEGWLSPMIARPTEVDIDFSEVKLQGGEFNGKQLNAIVDTDEVIHKAVRETVALTRDRHCGMVFATGIENSEHLAAMFQSFGVNALACHSKLKDEVNDERIAMLKNGELECLVSASKLTTGFDCPQVDWICDLAATMSVARHIQKMGRGGRVAPGKVNCLVLDFAKNVARLGPVNDPNIPLKTKKGKGGDAPLWICPSCGFYNHASARQCEVCGEEHVFAQKLFGMAGTDAIIASDDPEVKRFAVKTVMYNRHVKPGSPPMIRVDYLCGLKMFTEFVGFEHSRFVQEKARQWWMQRHDEDPPLTTDIALKKLSGLRMPRYLNVHVNKKPYPEILSAEWD